MNLKFIFRTLFYHQNFFSFCLLHRPAVKRHNISSYIRYVTWECKSDELLTNQIPVPRISVIDYRVTVVSWSEGHIDSSRMGLLWNTQNGGP